MKAELWKEIEDGYERSKNSPPVDVLINFCVPDENHPDRFKYHCESKPFWKFTQSIYNRIYWKNAITVSITYSIENGFSFNFSPFVSSSPKWSVGHDVRQYW